MLLLVAALVSLSAAAVIEQRSPPDDSDIECFTAMGSLSKSPKDIPTQIKTVFETVVHTDFNRVHPVATLDLKDETTTKTVAAQGKSALNGHLTPIAVTTTVTTTTTVTKQSTSTTTVATPPGFRPIKSTLPKPTPTGNFRQLSERDSAASRPKKQTKFAQAVECFSSTTTTITKTLARTNDAQSTVTNYGSTVTAAVAQANIAATTTKTVTKTKTTTNVVSGPTIYASCQQNNMYIMPNKNYTYIDTSGQYSYSIFSSKPATAYDCCVSCFTKFNCLGGQFSPQAYANTNYCYIYALDHKSTQSLNNLTALYGGQYDSDPRDALNPLFNGQFGEYTNSAPY